METKNGDHQIVFTKKKLFRTQCSIEFNASTHLFIVIPSYHNFRMKMRKRISEIFQLRALEKKELTQ